jgi:probable F420-dependent oxidoreductase
VDFGLLLVGLGLRDLAEVARAAEDHGFDSVWTTDHLVVPAHVASRYPYNEAGTFLPASTPMLDPWVVLTVAATATERVLLGTDVYQLPLRHPFSTARAAATLDRFSGGRVVLGVGVGWMEEEFRAAGEPFHDRGARTDEAIGILRRLWREDEVEHHGAFYDFDAVGFAPKPAQAGGIPVVVGGTSPPALRRAARLGDGWIDAGIADVDELAGRLGTLARLRAEAGRDQEPFTITTSAAHDAVDVARCDALGVTRVLTSPPRGGDDRPRDRFLAWIERFADEVMAGWAP